MASQTSSLRILVIDDDPSLLSVVRRSLTARGHAVEVFRRAEEALTAFAPGKFDLVITDYEMPGMMGDRLAKSLKEKAPDQRIIMASGRADELRGRVDPVAAQLILNKPFNLKELLRSMTEVLSQPV